MTRLLCVIVCLVVPAVFNNGVFGATMIHTDTPYADIGERVDISCTGGNDIDPAHEELQWRRSSDDVIDVQNAQKIIDTNLDATLKIWDSTINQTRFDISKNGEVPPKFFFTIKSFAPSDVSKYWCRFFRIPATVRDEIASLKINTREPPTVVQMAIIHSGIRYSDGDTIEPVEDGDVIVCEVNGTRPAVNISWEAPDVQLTPGETIYTQNPYDSDLIDAKRNATVGTFKEPVKVTCIASNKRNTDPVQIFVTITKPETTTAPPSTAGLGPGAIGGITVGCLAVAGGVSGAGYVYYSKRSKTTKVNTDGSSSSCETGQVQMQDGQNTTKQGKNEVG